MYSCNKNSYLQGNVKGLNAGLLNRAVQKAFNEITIDAHDFDPPLQRLTSEQPLIPIENIDPTRRPQGFGRWALPKLRRELHNKKSDVVLAALTSICDLVHDPEKCFEAIKIKIIDRLVDLLTSELPAIRERTAMVLCVIAEMAAGKEAIVRNPMLLVNLQDKVEDPFPEVRLHIAACLEMLARFWQAADVLVQSGFIQVLLANLFDEPEIVEYHLETLKSMVYCDGKKIAIEEDGFETLIKMFDREEEEILAKTCQLFARLCMIHEGRKLAQKFNLLPTLNRLLHEERKDIYAAAAKAIMFCTIKSSEKITASKIKTMPRRLVHLCKNRLDAETQMYCIQALTMICEHPLVRKEVSKKYYKELEAIELSEHVPDMKKFKSTLMSKLQWVPYTKEI